MSPDPAPAPSGPPLPPGPVRDLSISASAADPASPCCAWSGAEKASVTKATATSRTLDGIHIRAFMMSSIRSQTPRAVQLWDLPEASARRVLGQELLHGLLRRRLVLGLLPVLDERGVRRERRDLA